MGLTTTLTEIPLSVEIGKTVDFKTHSLVSRIATITHDCGEIDVMATSDWRFELWHPTGLKLRVNFEETLDICADLLAEELEQREAA